MTLTLTSLEFPQLLLIIKALVCLGIALRVLFYHKGASRHRPLVAWLAYLLIIAAASETIDCAHALYTHGSGAPLAEVFMLSLLLGALAASRGNVVGLFWTGQSSRRERWLKAGSHHVRS